MQRAEFTYNLPQDLIAQYPPKSRGDSRLLYLDVEGGEIADHAFADLISIINLEDILVFNNTRVLPARLYGRKDTGGKVEILVERVLGTGEMLAQIRAGKSPKIGTLITLENQTVLQVIARKDDFFIVKSASNTSLTDILEEMGHMPLPPYIKRSDEELDRERYQTVFSRQPGAVAAPTAGLHFTEGMMEKIRDKGCKTGFVTLHVAAGTFQPVRVENIEDHKMHTELFQIDKQLCESIKEVKRKGGRVIAVGTTTVRVLESVASENGELQPQQGETNIFIYPDFNFRVIDALITNFHLPESTLLMLVCAFAGRKNVLAAYGHAIKARYRFFSYGDAMFINNKRRATSN